MELAGPPGESRETRLRRLHMRSIRRGIREMDLILGAFAREQLPGLSESRLDEYERLLAESDHDIYRWVTTGEGEPEGLEALMALVRKGAEGVGTSSSSEA
ncbi:succinate dehydrogenase assembly factor 2 [Pseudoroseicyclus sp. CXY001]|uniref:succinate dehydrogenase assembly factor 2 n=1 Tax=Pseudoroseicyclus sp. CXY001 TaxID=3242492 RepID=UPI003570E47C